MSKLDSLLADIEQLQDSSDLRKCWNPAQVGSIDIHIKADGSWHHEGRPFLRQSLVKLFAGILRREGDDHFLVTPVEKLKIKVDDAPFTAPLVEQVDEGNRVALMFTTNLGDKILVDAEHPIRLDIDPETQVPRPYVHYRDGMDALIGRNAFYELIALASESEREGKTFLTISSLGYEFDLGCIDLPEKISLKNKTKENP